MKSVLAAVILFLGLGGGWLVWNQRNVSTPGSTMADAAPGERAAMLATAASPDTPVNVSARPLRNAGTSSSPLLGGSAFVINSAGASVDLIDVATRKLVRRIPVLREPHHMALTPDRRFLIIGDTVANEILFLNPKTGDVERRMPISDPYQFGFSPDGR